MAIGISAWQLIYEISPIFLQDGLVSAIGVPSLPAIPGIPGLGGVPGLGGIASPGAMLPIILATEALNAGLGLLTTGTLPSLDDAFCHFQPMSGASVLDQQIATYPFANNAVAANAVITQPLKVSFQMTAPARGTTGYWAKSTKMMALITILEQHNQRGGRYALVTPSYVWLNTLMRNMRDTSSAQTKQVQTTWMLDFEKPLITVSDAQNAQQMLSDTLGKLDAGTATPATTVQGVANPTITGAFNQPSN